MTFKPTIHHIVKGQSACGQGVIGYAEYEKVFVSPNACRACISSMQLGDTMVMLQEHCDGIREAAGKIRTHQLKLEVLRNVKQMELILNKFVK